MRRSLLWLLLVPALLLPVLYLGGRGGRTLEHPPLVLVMADPDRWAGLDGHQRRGLMLILKDLLELGTRRPVLDGTQLLDPPAPSMTVLTFSAVREGDHLGLRLALSGGEGVRTADLKPGEGPQVLASALAWLKADPRGIPDLVPREPEGLWDLLACTGWDGDWALEPSIPVITRLTEREPQCAAAWATRAHLTYRDLILHNTGDMEAQLRCVELFQRALKIVPGYPRAAHYLVRFKTDIGSQREALELGFAALEARPWAVHMYGALTYAARTSGLLDGALHALGERDRLVGPLRGDAGLAENTYLYAGMWDRFERSLSPSPGELREPLRYFYRGYIRLVRGDPQGAVPHFRATFERPGGVVQFEELARVYDLKLQGKDEEALVRLRKLWQDRVRLRVPDGEFTFKVAEAFAYLGQRNEALEVGGRAFAQGFSCVRWYRESPMLASMRGLPPWEALLAHMEERQKLLARQFPPERFGR